MQSFSDWFLSLNNVNLSPTISFHGVKVHFLLLLLKMYLLFIHLAMLGISRGSRELLSLWLVGSCFVACGVFFCF